jgi:hypothetical protein
MRKVLRTVGYGALMLLSLAINLPLLAAFVYEAYVTFAEFGWWWGILLHGGVFVFVAVVIWPWTGERLLEWWEWRSLDRRYGEVAKAHLATPPRVPDLARAYVPARGSFAALAEAERAVRARRG